MDLEINNNAHNNNVSNNFSNELKEYVKQTEITYSIDRFEGEYAVCENKKTGEFINIPKNILPDNCKEGSILKFINGNYILDIEETKKEQENIKKLVDNLFKKNK